MQIYIPSELGYEKLAISAVKTMAKQVGFSAERIDDVKTALSEAVLNAIEHGNQLNAELKVLIALAIQEQSLILSVVDQGKQLIPSLALERRERVDNRGWGLFLIKNLMDEVEVMTSPGHNEIRMVAHLKN